MLYYFIKSTHLKQDVDISLLCSDAVFKSIFEANFKFLRNFLLFKFKNVERAEDAAQNAFVILWENCSTLRPEQAKQFLFTTAIRLSLNSIKHEKVVLNFELKTNQNQSDIQSPEFLLIEKELQKQLEKALLNLPEKQRIVFFMNRFENHTYKEIAVLLDISVKTVEKRMHNTLLELRKVIATL